MSCYCRYPKTNPWDIMLGMNLWGTIYNAVIMFVAPLLFSNWPYANGFEAVRFCQENPEVAWDILLFCLCGAVGQNFIFLTISRFGSLTNTTITTTRKFMSIVISSVISGNPLSLKQWGSVVMVFSGLSLQIFLKWKRKKVRDHKEWVQYFSSFQFVASIGHVCCWVIWEIIIAAHYWFRRSFTSIKNWDVW